MLKRLMILTCLTAACAEADGQQKAAEAAPAEDIVEDLEEQSRMLNADLSPVDADTAYAFSFDGLVHDQIDLAAFKGRPILVVNTASECGFTPQYAGLQETFDRYKDEGLMILGVPSNDFGGQEPGSAEDIEKFCRLNYGVTFAMAGKSVVSGDDAHPFYQWAEEKLGGSAVPKWNFHKILIGADGQPVEAFPSAVSPGSKALTSAIEAALAG